MLRVQEAFEAQQRFPLTLGRETIVEEGFKKRLLKLAKNWLKYRTDDGSFKNSKDRLLVAS